ncbi:MAG: hypothetical protein KKB85_03600 [Candidatus Altiarchaeota archaeon]|nr:hypothetical protein [Candidatus Altiarchaeota archaeon]
MNGRVIAFRVYKNTDAKTTNRFCQKFYGQDSTSHGGKYKHHKHGLMEDIPHVKLIRGVVIVAEKDARKVINFLRKFNAEIHSRKVILTTADKKALRPRS